MSEHKSRQTIASSPHSLVVYIFAGWDVSVRQFCVRLQFSCSRFAFFVQRRRYFFAIGGRHVFSP